MAKTDARETTGQEPAGLKRGAAIELVNWTGDQFRLAAGRYRGRTATHWLLAIDGVEGRYPRSEWSLCIR